MLFKPSPLGEGWDGVLLQKGEEIGFGYRLNGKGKIWLKNRLVFLTRRGRSYLKERLLSLTE